MLPLIVVNPLFPDLKRLALFSQVIIAVIVFRADVVQSVILDTVADLFTDPRLPISVLQVRRKSRAVKTLNSGLKARKYMMERAAVGTYWTLGVGREWEDIGTATFLRQLFH